MFKQNMQKLLRFGLVGLVGTVINFSVYWVTLIHTPLGVNMSAIVAFGVAVTNNYILNHSWTFARENEKKPINQFQFSKYFLGNILGLSVNLLVLNTLIVLIGVKFHFIGQLLGIACGMLFNFIIAKKIVFPDVRQKTKSKNEVSV